MFLSNSHTFIKKKKIEYIVWRPFLSQTKCCTYNRFWLRVPHRRETPLTCCLISCETKGVVYHQVSDLKLGGTLGLRQKWSPHIAF